MSELLRLFTRAGKLMRAAADEAMSEHGVRVGQNLLLEVLWEDDGLTPGELAARLRVTTPTVVNAATRMEAAGLVTRRRTTPTAGWSAWS
jgi:DNA-binding MarR family transcriptional regulator